MVGKASKCDPGIPDGVSLSLLLRFHFSSCWLWHGPTLALGAIWRMDQWMESSLSPTSLSISLCNCVKESDLRNNSNGDMIRCSSPQARYGLGYVPPFLCGIGAVFPLLSVEVYWHGMWTEHWALCGRGADVSVLTGVSSLPKSSAPPAAATGTQWAACCWLCALGPDVGLCVYVCLFWHKVAVAWGGALG